MSRRFQRPDRPILIRKFDLLWRDAQHDRPVCKSISRNDCRLSAIPSDHGHQMIRFSVDLGDLCASFLPNPHCQFCGLKVGLQLQVVYPLLQPCGSVGKALELARRYLDLGIGSEHSQQLLDKLGLPQLPVHQKQALAQPALLINQPAFLQKLDLFIRDRIGGRLSRGGIARRLRRERLRAVLSGCGTCR